MYNKFHVIILETSRRSRHNARNIFHNVSSPYKLFQSCWCASRQKGNSSESSRGVQRIRKHKTRIEDEDDFHWENVVAALPFIQPIGPLMMGLVWWWYTYKACIMKVFIMLKMHSRTVMCTERENPPPTWAERNVIKCGRRQRCEAQAVSKSKTI